MSRDTSRCLGFGVKLGGEICGADGRDIRRESLDKGSLLCHPTFSGGYSSVLYVVWVLGPAVVVPPLPFPPDDEDLSWLSHCNDSRSSRGIPIYFDSRFDRPNLDVGVPVESS